MNSFDLFIFLEKLDLSDDSFERIYYNTDIFEIIIGCILVQQTKWENVEIAINILKQNEYLEVEKFITLDEITLSSFIKFCSFANTKAKRLLTLAKNILNDFNSFDDFKNNVDRRWLLSQKGLGFESSDYILCYACKRPVMVVDNYSARLLLNFGYEFESYGELQEWFMKGIYENKNRIEELYKEKFDDVFIFAKFHGLIVKFCKKYMKGNKLNLKFPEL